LARIKTYEVESGARYRVFWKDPSGKQHAKGVRATHAPSSGPPTMLWTQGPTRTRAEGASPL